MDNPICITDTVSNKAWKKRSKEKKLSIQTLGLIARNKNYRQQCLKMNPGWLPTVFFKTMPNCLRKYINQRLPKA